MLNSLKDLKVSSLEVEEVVEKVMVVLLLVLANTILRPVIKVLSEQLLPGSKLHEYHRMGSEQRSKLSQSMEVTKTPGPGSYSLKSYVGEGPKVGFKARNNNSGLSISKVPGPGAYQPNISAIIQKPPSIGLGRERRDNLISRSDNAKVPGPGTYSVNDKIGGPKFGFGTSKRVAEKLSDAPGPGKYDLPMTIGDLPPHERSKRL